MHHHRDDTSSLFSRRGFLKLCGLAAVGSFSMPALNAAGRPTATTPTLNVGLLLPSSSMHPDIGRSIRAGMHAYAGTAGMNIVLHPMEVEAGYGPALRAVKQLLDRGVDVLSGMIDVGVASMLRDVLRDSGIVLVAINAGANVPRHDEHSPYTYHITLNHWQANWTFGQWASTSIGSRAFMAVSFYESGYDAQYAFRHGFASANGTVVDSVVSHVPPARDTLRTVLARIEHVAPDFVYAAYAGDEAVEFVRAYADAGLAERIPLVGSTFLVDESLLPRQGHAALGIKSCFSWAGNQHTREYQHFVNAYQRHTGAPVNAFALLGYDTAHALAEVVDALDGDLSRPERVQRALAEVAFTSPRGSVRMDADTQSLESPLYVREVQQRDGTYRNVAIAELDPVHAADERVAELRSGIRTGWTNPYLGI